MARVLSKDELIAASEKMDRMRATQAQTSRLGMVIETAHRQLSPGIAESVAISLSHASRFALEGGATKEQFLVDVNKIWDDQARMLEQQKEQNAANEAAVKAKLEELMAQQGHTPVGEPTVLQFPTNGAAGHETPAPEPVRVLGVDQLAGAEIVTDAEGRSTYKLNEAGDTGVAMAAAELEPPPVDESKLQFVGEDPDTMVGDHVADSETPHPEASGDPGDPPA